MHMMTTEREFLYKLDYTSSEEDYVDFDEDKEQEVNLNRRKSKMGKQSGRPATKPTRRSKRKAQSHEQNNYGLKENKQTRSSNSKGSKKSKKHNILAESKKPLNTQTAGYITTRRLTAGVTGIFGNSKASDMVKRRGKKPAVDLSKRKISAEVKQQVDRDLDRILKRSSFDIRKPSAAHNQVTTESEDEENFSPAVCNDLTSYQHLRASHQQSGQLSASSTISTKTPSEMKTPHTELAQEVPLDDISRRLKDSLIIANLFQGKGYLEELREELWKTYRQEISILKDAPTLSSNEHTPETSRKQIVPISVSMQKFHSSHSRPHSIARRSLQMNDVNQQRDLLQQTSSSSASCHTQLREQSTATTVLPVGKDEECAVDCKVQEQRSSNSIRSSRIDICEKRSPSFAIINAQSTSTEVNPAGHQATSGSQATDNDYNGQPWRFENNDHLNLFRQNRDALSHHDLPNYLYPPQQHQQDSGTYSSESAARDFLNVNHALATDMLLPIDNSPHLNADGPFFQPRRQGNRENIIPKRLSFQESAYHRRFDHDYVSEPGNFDILHYAGTIGDDHEDINIAMANDRTNNLSTYSYVPLQKRPCVDTPTPPIQLYRMKMF